MRLFSQLGKENAVAVLTALIKKPNVGVGPGSIEASLSGFLEIGRTLRFWLPKYF